ncbi:FAD:protein FMN transferase [Methylobacillus gramineus]|uniref:FAD:protein FMN transferase n=1 Tax=Methylobacillus gramineus TaxID=755169 RepID=UPI001CFFD97B|nr:FAD:protein FMN transferase [Methylobacillus gramineus]MCB5185246.1 FAD:protein FMN transferase [Methylobacillus gramineus]
MRRVLIAPQLGDLPRQLPGGFVHSLSGQTMGTTWTVRYVAVDDVSGDQVAEAIQAALDQVNEEMSTWLERSAISQFNQAAAGSWHHLTHGFATVLKKAIEIAALTDGTFDPTIGPLVNIWGFGPDSYHAASQRAQPPPIADILLNLARCGWQKLQFNQSNQTLLQTGSVYLDFSGIAKGYGVDQVVVALRTLGLAHFLVEVGGELYGSGIKPDGHPWWVALERPQQESGLDENVVALHGMAIATSGDYRRYFEHHGKRYAHTIDPHTGFPVEHAPVSVTVLHTSCMEADALATALTVMGLRRGLAYANTHGIAALFIVNESGSLSAHDSPALAEMLE